MRADRVALVIGATGVTGAPLVETLLDSGEWKVYGVARREPRLRAGTPLARFRHLAIDLADRGAVGAAIRDANDVTHVFHSGNDGSRPARLAMLANLLDAMDEHAQGFANLHLTQGMKYYGVHLGPFSIPARETDPRVAGGDFYYSEEDQVLERRRRSGWAWTSLRPHSVCGYTPGNPVNLASMLAVYGSLLRALGLPFGFPASAACFETRFHCTDAHLLARAAIRISTESACADQAFNVCNGEPFRWCDLWPTLAAWFGLPPAGPQPWRLDDFLAQHADLWRSLAERHGLVAYPYERLPRWVAGDYRAPHSRFACEYDNVADISKLRAGGFGESLDNAAMFTAIFERLRQERVIP